MAVTFDSIKTGGGFPSNPTTISGHALGFGSGNDRIVLVFVGTVGGTLPPTFITASYNGVAMNQLVQSYATVFSSAWTSSVFYLLDSSLPSSAGSYDFQYQTSGGPFDSKVAIISYIGASQSVPLYTSSSLNEQNPAVSGTYSTNINLVSSAGMIVDNMVGLPSSTATGTPGASQTERADTGDADEIFFVSDKTFSSSGSNSMSWTPSTSYFCISHVLLELAQTNGIPATDNAIIMGAAF